MNLNISELLVIAFVALLVIKPAQLPNAAYKLGHCVRTLRHFFLKTKNDLTSLLDTTQKHNDK